jgi:hypothetical protein
MLLAPVARAVPGGPAFRLEGDYGILTNGRTYQGAYTNGPQTILIQRYQLATGGAFGMRATGGYAINLRSLSIFPRLSIGYVPNNHATTRIRGDLDEYTFDVERRAFSLDAGAEVQLFRRQWLIEGALGIASTHSSFQIPGYAVVQVPASYGYVTRSPVSDDSGLLAHLATGWRAPLELPVTFGVKATGEAVFGTRYLDRLVTVPMLRAMLSLFVEFEPLHKKDAQ